MCVVLRPVAQIPTDAASGIEISSKNVVFGALFAASEFPRALHPPDCKEDLLIRLTN
jgi:hypothetical protein